MFKTQCINCGHRFSEREALCDDWRDPEKANGCPRCETFFYRKEINRDRYTQWIGTLFAVGMLLPAFSILLDAEDGLLQFRSGMILFFGLIIVGLSSSDLFREWKRSPWTDQRRQENH